MIGVAVIVTGLWSQNEQRKQFEYNRINTIQDRNTNENTVTAEQVEYTNQDPFGLFGAEEVVYEVTFETLWSEETHKNNYIRTAHFSPPVVWVGPNNPVFSLGGKATLGIEDMAETGRTSDLKKELEELLDQNRISQYIIGERMETPEIVTYQVTLDRENPVISLVSMIAPSPDWFVALEGLSLLEEGRWVEEKIIQTLSLDAGTEEGIEFKISNPETDPRGTITELTDIPSRSIPPFATVHIKQIGYEGN